MTDIQEQSVASKGEETRILLERGSRRAALADEYEAKAVAFAEQRTLGSRQAAAECFVIAAGLRGRARFLP